MFKVGDRVWCKFYNPKKDLHPNKSHVITHIYGEWMALSGNSHLHHVGDFAKVNEMTTTENKTIINEKAKPKTKAKVTANAFFVRRVGGSNPKVVHTTYKDAFNEANRLAELNPDAEFQVIGLLYSVKKVPVYTTQAQEYSV